MKPLLRAKMSDGSENRLLALLEFRRQFDQIRHAVQARIIFSRRNFFYNSINPCVPTKPKLVSRVFKAQLQGSQSR